MKFTLFALSFLVQTIYIGHAVPISGGRDMEFGNAPYMCALKITNGNVLSRCGCSILSNKWVLTAAHCIVGAQCQNFGQHDEKIEILVGTNYINDSDVNEHESTRKYYQVDRCIGHQNYDDEKKLNDIAVVQVQGEIEFNEQVQPIRFSSKVVPTGVNAQVMGWGLLETDKKAYLLYNLVVGPNPKHLQVLNVNTTACLLVTIPNDEQRICTLTTMGEGHCSGDSGGPLVWNNEVIGVVTFSTGICAIGRPDGYARVSYFYDWIMEQIKSV